MGARQQVNDRGFGVDPSLLNSSYWANASSCEPKLRRQTDEEMLRRVKQLFGPALAAVLTTSIVTSVVSSIVSSLGAGAALSTPSCGGGAMTLVAQIQFLTVTCQVGGSHGPPALQDFSSSLEWANYRFPISLYDVSRCVYCCFWVASLCLHSGSRMCLLLRAQWQLLLTSGLPASVCYHQ